MTSEEPKQTPWWQSRSNQALGVFLAIAAYFLWTEHQAHVIAFLPWLLIAGCLVMHAFMHRGHGHGSGGHSGDDEPGDKP